MNEKYASLIQKHSELRLQIELVPDKCWFSNVRSNVSTRDWDIIRRQVYVKADYKCEICGGIGPRHPVECHEIWSYDDKKHLQKLEKLQALCPLCHEVKHFGFATIRGFRNRALNRFMRINNLNLITAEDIIDAVRLQWESRSGIIWELNIDLLKDYGVDISSIKMPSK